MFSLPITCKYISVILTETLSTFYSLSFSIFILQSLQHTSANILLIPDLVLIWTSSSDRSKFRRVYNVRRRNWSERESKQI